MNIIEKIFLGFYHYYFFKRNENQKNSVFYTHIAIAFNLVLYTSAVYFLLIYFTGIKLTTDYTYIDVSIYIIQIIIIQFLAYRYVKIDKIKDFQMQTLKAYYPTIAFSLLGLILALSSASLLSIKREKQKQQEIKELFQKPKNSIQSDTLKFEPDSVMMDLLR